MYLSNVCSNFPPAFVDEWHHFNAPRGQPVFFLLITGKVQGEMRKHFELVCSSHDSGRGLQMDYYCDQNEIKEMKSNQSTNLYTYNTIDIPLYNKYSMEYLSLAHIWIYYLIGLLLYRYIYKIYIPN